MGSFRIEVTKMFEAHQGLTSPVRASSGKAPSETGSTFSVKLKLGISFDEDQLTERGWFVDSDAVEQLAEKYATRLGATKWTEQFDFRPTFENVSRWLFNELEPAVPQLAYIQLENSTLGVSTSYSNRNLTVR